MLTVPTKFHAHTTVFSNLTSGDPWMTSDDPEMTFQKFGAKCWLYPPSFMPIRQFLVIWPQMTSGWPWMTQHMETFLVKRTLSKLAWTHRSRIVNTDRYCQRSTEAIGRNFYFDIRLVYRYFNHFILCFIANKNTPLFCIAYFTIFWLQNNIKIKNVIAIWPQIR